MHGKDVRLKSLSVAFGRTTALHPTTLDVGAGEVVALLGPSGCGKTTLLRTLAGFLAPTLGRMSIGGVDVTEQQPERRPTVLLHHPVALFPTMRVVDDVAFGLEARGHPREARRRRAEEMLALVGLAGREAFRSDDLADEDRRRVALARALAVDPAVVLLDEPFAGLEPHTRRRLRDDVAAIGRHTGTTLLWATDDPDDAVAVCDRIAVMNAGRIEQIDTPDRLRAEPATPFVARFVAEQNVLPGRIAAVRSDRVEVDTPVGRIVATPRAPLAPGDAVEVMIRPERLVLESERIDRGRPAAGDADWNRLRGDLVGRRLQGPLVAHDVAIGETRLVLYRPDLGLRDVLLAGLHAVGFEAEDALAFPRPDTTEERP